MFKKLKEKKGFTLVELIVVLVILAILAALLIPALTGYIDKAKNKSVIAETRQAVMAAQTLVDEEYGKTNEVGGTATLNASAEEIKKLAEVDGTVDKNTLEVKDGKITKLTYTNAKGDKTCTYMTKAPADTSDYIVEGKYYISK